MNREIQIEEVENLLRQLVQVDTSQPEGNEALLVDFIESRYRTRPVEFFRIAHQDNRASLIIKVPGKTDQGAVAFVGHLDTVPFGELSQWAESPLAASVQNGKLTGRGAADMKGGIAAMLLTLDRILENTEKRPRTVLFCFTADEEKNGLGALALAKHDAMQSVKGLIVCEPSRGQLGLVEKGALWIKVTAEGKSAHASRPELGCNALEGIMGYLTAVRGIVETPEQHPYLGMNTLSVTTLNGGISQNIIPSTAEVTLDIRTLPGVSHQELLNKFQDLALDQQKGAPSLKIHLEILNDRPALESDPETPFIQKILACGEQCGMDLAIRGLYFYTDASQLVPALKVPFAILGPGDDRQAHVVNENIDLESINVFTDLYYKICLTD